MTAMEDLQKALNDWQLRAKRGVLAHKAGMYQPNGEWVLRNIEKLQELFSAFSAREQALRKLLDNLESNEKGYSRAKEDYGISDSMVSFLDGRIRESEIIRIKIGKVLDFEADKK